MTDEIPQLNWTPKGERCNQLQNLVALSLMVQIGKPPTQENIDQHRARYLSKYLEFGGDDADVIQSLSEMWTAQDLQQRLEALNGKI